MQCLSLGAVPGWPKGTSAFRRLHATGTAASGSVMSCRSPKNVIVAKRERAPLAAPARACRSDLGTDLLTRPHCSGVTLRDLIERKEEGS
jgi:hypothetical protein